MAQSKPSEIKIAVVQFLSGAAAPHDASAINTARLLTEQFNTSGGIEGVRLNTMYVDEAGSTADKVAEFRRLVQDEKIAIAIGYTSSANCLAVAPLADELKTLTIFHVCANYRLFDKEIYKYVFRTAAHAASENISAALYVLAINPNLKTIAGLNCRQDDPRERDLAHSLGEGREAVAVCSHRTGGQAHERGHRLRGQDHPPAARSRSPDRRLSTR